MFILYWLLKHIDELLMVSDAFMCIQNDVNEFRHMSRMFKDFLTLMVCNDDVIMFSFL